jgi:hypothetical protein
MFRGDGWIKSRYHVFPIDYLCNLLDLTRTCILLPPTIARSCQVSEIRKRQLAGWRKYQEERTVLAWVDRHNRGFESEVPSEPSGAIFPIGIKLRLLGCRGLAATQSPRLGLTHRGSTTSTASSSSTTLSHRLLPARHRGSTSTVSSTRLVSTSAPSQPTKKLSVHLQRVNY